MADISGILGEGAWQAVSSVLGGQSQGPVNNINSFINKVTAKLSPTRLIGNTYANQNVLEVMSTRTDPVTNFDWIAVVVNKGLSLNTTIPWYYINDIQTPSLSLSAADKYRAGRLVKFAELFTVDSCNIKIYSDTTGQAFNFCNDWVRSAYRDDDLYQLPSAYKKDIIVYILDVKRQIVVDVKLVGCFPTSWAGYNLSSGAASALETSLTLSVDDVRVNYDSQPTSIIASVNKALGGFTDSISSAAKGAFDSTVGSIASSLGGFANPSPAQVFVGPPESAPALPF